MPESNAAALRGLGERGVVDGTLAETMARASRFRNLLVHQYGTIDDQLDALGSFVREVLGWISARSLDRSEPA